MQLGINPNFGSLSFRANTSVNQYKKEEVLKTEANQPTFLTKEIKESFVKAPDAYSGVGTGYRKNTIGEGYTKYLYYDANFSFYKKGDEIKGEYVTPKDVDAETMIEDFFSEVPALRPSGNTNVEAANKTTKASNPLGVNGEIDEATSQGTSGDCWLLAGVNSLSETPKGRAIIKDSISYNEDRNSVSVYFRGLNIVAELPGDYIQANDTDNNPDDLYSNGDNDMLVMELALDYLWKYYDLQVDSKKPTISYINKYDGINDGGYGSQIVYYLTGVESDEYYDEYASDLSTKQISNCLKQVVDDENKVMTFAIYYGTHSAKLIDGSTYTIDLGDAGHAFSVKEVTSNTITFVNPWDSETSYTMSWREFAKLGIGYVSIADISSVEVNEEAVEEVENNEVDNLPSLDEEIDEEIVENPTEEEIIPQEPIEEPANDVPAEIPSDTVEEEITNEDKKPAQNNSEMDFAAQMRKEMLERINNIFSQFNRAA